MLAVLKMQPPSFCVAVGLGGLPAKYVLLGEAAELSRAGTGY